MSHTGNESWGHRVTTTPMIWNFVTFIGQIIVSVIETNPTKMMGLGNLLTHLDMTLNIWRKTDLAMVKSLLVETNVLVYFILQLVDACISPMSSGGTSLIGISGCLSNWQQSYCITPLRVFLLSKSTFTHCAQVVPMPHPSLDTLTAIPEDGQLW